MVDTIKNCLICTAPLGNDSREGNYPTCSKHRTCSICHKDITAIELKILITTELVEEMVDPLELLQHARCGIRNNAIVHPTLTNKREILMLNVSRLLLSVNMDCTPSTNKEIAGNIIENLVVDQSFEETYMLLKVMESIQARLSVLCGKKDKSKVESQLAEIRKERAQATKPPISSKPTTSETEKYGIPIARWNGLSKAEQTLIKNREKAIEAMQNIPGFTREMAVAAFDKARGGKH